MCIDKVLSALDSKFRREVLRIVLEEPKTVMQVFNELRDRGMEVKYREVVYRALEKLLDAGLVDKEYVKGRGLCYRAKARAIVINLANDSIDFHQSM